MTVFSEKWLLHFNNRMEITKWGWGGEGEKLGDAEGNCRLEEIIGH